MNMKTGELLISLLAAMLNGENPRIEENTDISALVSLAEHHSVANIVGYMDIEAPDSIKQRLCECRDKALMADMHQQLEYEVLCEAFSSAGIRFIPLKGILMKRLYPQTDYRTMSDIDLLIDECSAKKVQEIMLSLGYNTESFDHDVHDVYHKKPAVSIEIHRELFGADGAEYAAIFADPWNMCADKSDGCCEFTHQAFFIFLLAHGMKHYSLGGTGIRTFMDVSIYLKKYGKEIDLDKVYETFGSVGRRRLCEDFVKLSDVWFGDAEYDDNLRRMAEYIIIGGTYGTIDNHVQQELQSKSKAQYIWGKLFPNLKIMRQRYPVLKKAPVLLPIFWLVRIVTMPVINRRQNIAKLKALTKK